ncbi:unnamed protein product [Cuscuta campestris]|uniref:Uncharacterized protein n=1 Tax=Cuscuta campestris TaxID=132261 RepID=A0A484L013_9ASTE|nr:unnamed protein product [Cuscuta campestris]
MRSAGEGAAAKFSPGAANPAAPPLPPPPRLLLFTSLRKRKRVKEAAAWFSRPALSLSGLYRRRKFAGQRKK